MSSSTRRSFDVLAIALMVALTLSTAYIHYWVGGTMLLLNAAGYVGLTVLVIGSFVWYRVALPLVVLALTAYAATTIVGWLILGPYFDVAYIAKGIEVVLIATNLLFIWRHRAETRSSINWGVALVSGVLPGAARRRSADGESAAAVATSGAEE